MKLTIHQFVAMCRYIVEIAGKRENAFVGGKYHAAKIFVADGVKIAAVIGSLEIEIEKTKTTNPVIMVDEHDSIYRSCGEWVDIEDIVIVEFTKVNEILGVQGIKESV